jgi:osmotically-inducible protein OsmY
MFFSGVLIMFRVSIVLSLFFVVIALSACLPVAAVGTGVAVGAKSTQEGGLSAAGTDIRIRAEINDLWFKYDFETFRKLDLQINQGRVLITGVVQKPEARVEAIRLVWQVKGVKEVINEVTVAGSEGFKGYLEDKWIASKIKTMMLLDKDIRSLNYSTDTVQQTIYIMGVADTQAELNKVLETARSISGVRRVVSYVKLRGEAAVPAPYQPAQP